VWKQRLSPDVTSSESRSSETGPAESPHGSDEPADASVVFEEASAEVVEREAQLRSGVQSAAAPTRIGTASANETPTDEEIPTVFESEPPLASALPVARIERVTPPAPEPPSNPVARRPRRETRAAFAGRRRAQPGVVDPGVIAEPAPVEAPKNWKAKTAAWVASMAAMGYGVSLFLHLAAIGALSVVVLAPKFESKPVGIDADAGGFGQGSMFDGDSFDPGGSGASEAKTDVEIVPGLVGAGISADALTTDVQQDALAAAGIGVGGKEGNGQGSGEGDGIGDGKGLPFAMPGAGKVTMKGSFTAWTVPEDPKPEEDYTIVIQIRLPPGVKKIPKRDLEGSIVEGTDKYRLHIPTPRMPTFLPVSGAFAQLVVPVPGARSLVRDKITVKSRILKESQTLEIEF
jgi:hypothetical protein